VNTSKAASTNADSGERPLRRFALFDYGFRPFFLAAGMYALVVVPVWLYFFAHHGVAFGGLPAMYWHAHELLYGFVVAAISGFMLTAVPSWTGASGFAGRPLIALVLLWLLGRIAMTTVGYVPFLVTTAAELALLPALIALLTPSLVRSQNRNTPLLFVLAVLWLTDCGFMLGLRAGDVVLADRSVRLAINIALLLVTVIGGRIVPAFTGNALRQLGRDVKMTSRRWIEIAVIAAMLAIAVVDVVSPDGLLSGALAGVAAITHAVRLSGWHGLKTRGQPIVWILHVAYAWLPIGLALKAAWLLADATWAIKWQHALTMGVLATMILAVMTRAALGHTGRPLVVSRAIAVAYALLTVGVLVRVFGAAIVPHGYVWVVSVAGLAWTLAFLMYVVVYAPILMLPRVDSRPG
jgi:uncharacterized protein involved in response to NO